MTAVQDDQNLPALRLLQTVAETSILQDASMKIIARTLFPTQYAPNVPNMMESLYDASQTAGQPGIKFVVTRPSCFYPKHYFTKSVSGREIALDIFPRAFEEFLARHPMVLRFDNSTQSPIMGSTAFLAAAAPGP